MNNIRLQKLIYFFYRLPHFVWRECSKFSLSLPLSPFLSIFLTYAFRLIFLFGLVLYAKVRRAALFREKCDELVMLALAMTDKQILEAERRNLDPSDSVDAYRVGVVAIGNLVSGEGYVAENRRHDLVTRKEDHSPICDALAKYPKDANMQQACLVCLSNFMMGDGHGADLVCGASLI